MNSLGCCPLCKGNIIEKEKSFSCDNAKWTFDETFEEWQNLGCTYKINKSALKRFGKFKISKNEIKKLFENEYVVVKLKNRFTKEFYERYLLIDNEYGVKIDFETEVE